MFTVTTPPGNGVAQAAAFVRQLCPSARLTYSLGGTQKYELPSAQVPGLTAIKLLHYLSCVLLPVSKQLHALSLRHPVVFSQALNAHMLLWWVPASLSGVSSRHKVAVQDVFL